MTAQTSSADQDSLSALDEPIKSVGVVGQMAGKFKRLDLFTVRDLLFHLPRKYNDFSHSMTLAELRNNPPEAPVSATVEIVDLRVEQGFRRRIQRTVARLRDETGEGEAIWFGRRYIERRLAVGDVVALSGKVELRGWLPRFANPEFGAAGEGALHANRIVPVYRLTAGVTGAYLRTKIRAALDHALPAFDEYLPAAAKAELAPDAPDIAHAVEWMHFPPEFEENDRATLRLAFDELLALQIGMVARSRQRQVEESLPVSVDDARFAESIAAVEGVIRAQVARRRGGEAMEVSLTADQAEALRQIRADMAGARPMMRLLQGDVGSGKTAVAALAMAWVAD